MAPLSNFKDFKVSPQAATPTLPLSPEVREAYQDLYNKYEAELENTSDEIAIETLNDTREEVDTILDQDDTYRLNRNTELLADLLEQIKSTNKNLVVLKSEIAAVSDHIKTAATILAAIDRVLALVPAL